MSANQINPVNNDVSSSGTGNKANGVVQTQQPQNGPNSAWILCDNGQIYMNGIVVPSGGALDKIQAPDNSSYVQCLNGGDITTIVNTNNINVNNQYTSSTGQVSTTCNEFLVNSANGIDMQNVGYLKNPSPVYQSIVVTRGNISVGATVNYYQFDIDAAEFQCIGSGPPVETIQVQVNNDVNDWSVDYVYANGPQATTMLAPDGDAFRIDPNLQGQMEFEFSTQINYCFDGSTSVQDSSRLLICLFDKDAGQPIPQSMQFIHKNDQKHAYVTLRTHFWMELAQDNHALCPAIIDYTGQVKFSWQPYTPQTFTCKYYPLYV